MSGSEPPDVDFLVGPADEHADEHTAAQAGGHADEHADDVLDTSARGSSALRRSLAVAAAVLVAAVVVVQVLRGGSGSTSHPAAATGPTAGRSASSPSAHSPSAGSPSASVAYSPVTGPTVSVPACPPGAFCSISSSVPPAVEAAVRTRFPGTAVDTAASVLARRRGGRPPLLLSRTLTFLYGTTTGRVVIHRSGGDPGDTTRSVHSSGTGSTTRVGTTSRGFRIDVTVQDRSSMPLLDPDDLVGFAADPRLVVVR